MSQQPITDELKVKFLERLMRNLYHGKSVEWHVRIDHPINEVWDGDPNHLWGWIRVCDINSSEEVPKLFDCCDTGLSQDIGSEIVPDEDHVMKELPPYRIEHHVDVYFQYDYIKEIDNLKAKVAELTKQKEILGN